MIEKVTIVDVRTPQEFDGGNVDGSINIPLDQIVARLGEIRAMAKPLIHCCASGGRSGQAAEYLNQNGIECKNGGGWMQVNAEFRS